MAFISWLGGGTNNPAVAAEWNPAQVPTKADTPAMLAGGTMNITGDPLAGNTLLILDDPTTTTRAPITFNIEGSGALDQNMPLTDKTVGTITYNLVGNNAVFTGGFGSTSSDVFVKGTGTFVNGISGINGASATIQPNVTGTGQFFVLPAFGKNGTLEFQGSVAAGQTVDVRGDAATNSIGILQLDSPSTFAGTIDLGFGEIILQGVKGDSASLTNDLLTVQSGGTTVTTLKVHQVADTATGPGALTVSQSAGGTIIMAAANGSGTVAPTVPTGGPVSPAPTITDTSALGGSATAGTATAGSVTGGSATGGSATGGSAIGGTMASLNPPMVGPAMDFSSSISSLTV